MSQIDNKNTKLTDLLQDHFVVLAGILMLPSVLDKLKKPKKTAVEEIMTDPLKPILMIILALSGYIYFNHLQVLSGQLASHTVAFDKVYEKFEKTQDYLDEQTKTIMKIQNTQDNMLEKINTLNSRVDKIEEKK